MKTITERLRNVVSYSEIQGIKQVVGELNGTDEGIVIASSLADRAKITRSVIVNGMKLLEAAGVVETKSLGMKGTYIRVIDKKTLNELIA